MHASVGDHIVIAGRRAGAPERHCQVVEVRGRQGGPPYVVRWGDTGQEALIFPGSDASVVREEGTRTTAL